MQRKKLVFRPTPFLRTWRPVKLHKGVGFPEPATVHCTVVGRRESVLPLVYTFPKFKTNSDTQAIMAECFVH